MQETGPVLIYDNLAVFLSRPKISNFMRKDSVRNF